MASSTSILDYLGRGTHAARPAAPPIGAGGTAAYFETDTLNTFIWSGAAWVQINGGGAGLWASQISVPLLAAFTWANQGTATAIDSAVGIFQSAPSVGANALRVLFQAAPAPPYTRTALIAVHMFTSGSVIGVGFYDGTKVEAIEIVSTAPSLTVDRWTNVTTFASTQFQYNPLGLRPDIVWVRIKDDGANISFWHSSDGVNFVQVYTEARLAFLANVNSLCFFTNPSGAGEVFGTLMSWN